MHSAPPVGFVAPPVSLRRGVSDTDHGVRGKLHFDLDRDIVPDGLCVPAEITQDRRRWQREAVALDPHREVKHPISSHRARRDACIGDDVQVWITGLSWLQDRGCEAPIRVHGCVHIDGGPDRRQTSTKGGTIRLGADRQRVGLPIGRAHEQAAARDALHRADEGDTPGFKGDRYGRRGWGLRSGGGHLRGRACRGGGACRRLSRTGASARTRGEQHQQTQNAGTQQQTLQTTKWTCVHSFLPSCISHELVGSNAHGSP